MGHCTLTLSGLNQVFDIFYIVLLLYVTSVIKHCNTVVKHNSEALGLHLNDVFLDCDISTFA